MRGLRECPSWHSHVREPTTVSADTHHLSSRTLLRNRRTEARSLPSGEVPWRKRKPLDKRLQNLPAGVTCQVQEGEEDRSPVPAPCPAGHTCPLGNSSPVVCSAGTFCPPGSESPLDCPAGYYCPAASTRPLVCDGGSFCPERAAAPSSCPAGYKAKKCEGANTSEKCCDICPPGTYNDVSGSTVCKPCAPGYICTGISGGRGETAVSAICCCVSLIGTFQPAAMNVANTPCPKGARAPLLALALDRPGPTICPTEHALATQGESGWLVPYWTRFGPRYKNQEGSADGCCHCGKSWPIPPRRNRGGGCQYFDVHEATSVSICCEPDRHWPASGIEEEELDGRSSCQEKFFKPCTSGRYRDDLGSCTANVDCSDACRGGSGSFHSTFGVCQCDDAPKIETQCPLACKAGLPTISVTSDGIEEYNPSDGQRVIYDDEVPESIDLPKLQFLCARLREELGGQPLTPICRVTFQQTSAAGMNGLLKMPSSFTLRTRGHDKEAQQGVDPRVIVPRPVQCVQRGSSVVWEIKDGVYPVYKKVRGQQHFAASQDVSPYRSYLFLRVVIWPFKARCVALCYEVRSQVYIWVHYPGVQESLLNSHPPLDDSTFRILGSADQPLPKFFAYTFLFPGTFVFATSENSHELSVIVVLPDGVRCPSGAEFAAPLTSRSLSRLGVTSHADDLLLEVNWWTVIIGLVSVFGCTALVALTLWRCRHEAWTVLMWAASINTLKHRAKQEFPDEELLANIHELPGVKGNLTCTAVQFRHHVARSDEQGDIMNHVDAPSAAANVPLREAADSLLSDTQSADKRLLQVTFEKLLDFGQSLRCLVDDEKQAADGNETDISQLLQYTSGKTRQALLLIPNQQLWMLSPEHTKLLHAISDALTSGADGPGMVEALGQVLEPQITADQQATRGGRDLLRSFLASVDLGGVAVLDALDCAWLTDSEDTDQTTERLRCKLEALTGSGDEFDESPETLLVVYNTLFAETGYQEESLRGECTRFQAVFSSEVQKLKAVYQTMSVLPVKHAERWFETRDEQLKKLLDLESAAIRKMIGEAVSGVESGRNMIEVSLQAAINDMDLADGRALLSGLLASCVKDLADRVRHTRASFVKQLKQLMRNQDDALLTLEGELEKEFRRVADSSQSAKLSMLKQRHSEENKRLKLWSNALMQRLDDMRKKQGDLELVGTQEGVIESEVALRQQQKADQYGLEESIIKAGQVNLLDLHRARLSFLHEQAATECKFVAECIEKDSELHEAIAVQLCKRQLQILVVNGFKEGAERGDSSEVVKIPDLADGGWTATELAAALQAAREAAADPMSPPSHKTSALARLKESSEALARSVTTIFDTFTQNAADLHGKAFQLVLEELDARDATWASLLKAANREAADSCSRRASEEEVLRRTLVQRMAEIEQDFEKVQLLHEFLESSSSARVRSLMQHRRELMQARLKAWESLPVSGGLLSKEAALECWREVTETDNDRDDVLERIRKHRRQATGRYVVRSRKLLVQEEKRRDHQREVVNRAALVVTQPRSLTSRSAVSAADTLQKAVGLLAQKKLKSEESRRKDSLEQQFARQVAEIDEEMRRIEEEFGRESSPRDDDENREDSKAALERRRILLREKREAMVRDHTAREDALKEEISARFAEIKHDIWQKITDFAAEVESDIHQLDKVAYQIAGDVDQLYEKELAELRANAATAKLPRTRGGGHDAVIQNGKMQRQLAITRCQRLI
ncbi:gcc2 and gcc3 domain-containing protein, partial [Cystoisospora suis]